MMDEKNDLEQITQEIRKVIDNNKKFLDRVFDEDFESEDEGGVEAEAFEEL
ncbi:hypothetical protein [Geotalea uraniireducens]|nr:hypothetical protein [Geotalea uraniireducens]